MPSIAMILITTIKALIHIAGGFSFEQPGLSIVAGCGGARGFTSLLFRQGGLIAFSGNALPDKFASLKRRADAI